MQSRLKPPSTRLRWLLSTALLFLVLMDVSFPATHSHHRRSHPTFAVTSEGHWTTVSLDPNQTTLLTQRSRCFGRAMACCPFHDEAENGTVRQFHFDNPTIQYFNDAKDIRKSFLLMLEEAFANKTMTWFGDSWMRQKYMSIIAMLNIHHIPHTHNVTAYEMWFPSRNTSDTPYERVVDCVSANGIDTCTRYHPDHMPDADDTGWWTEHPLKKRPHHDHDHQHHHTHKSKSKEFTDMSSINRHKRRLNSASDAVSPTSTSSAQFYKYRCHCSTLWTLHVPSYNFTLHHVNLYKFHISSEYLSQLNPLFFVGAGNGVHYQVLLDLLPISDHVMVNVGLHEERTPLLAFTGLIRFFIDTLSEDMKKRPVTRRWYEEHVLTANQTIDLNKVPPREHRRHAFYLSEPVHFQGVHGYSDYFMKEIASKSPSMNESSMSSPSCGQEAKEAATAAVTEGLLKGSLNYIDPTDFLVTEGGFHMDNYPKTKGDCVHWCFIYEHFQARWSMMASLFSGRFSEDYDEVKSD